MELLTVVQLLGGLVLLLLGAEWLVRGSVRLAASMGMAPLVIGLTVVAFGTSAPELAVTLRSALSGEADLALGNVVGSNIANVLLILGASALVTPLAVKVSLIRLDVPVMILASGARRGARPRRAPGSGGRRPPDRRHRGLRGLPAPAGPAGGRRTSARSSSGSSDGSRGRVGRRWC